MTKTQIDQYDMLLSVENHFDDNSSAWTTNVPLAAAKTLISTKLDGLATQIAIQLQNPTGITIDKANLRNDLESKALSTSAAVSAYAAVSGQNDLYNEVSINKSTLSKFRDAELVGVVTNLHSKATTKLANLAPYGLTAPVLTDLLQANTAFAAVMKNPTIAIAKRKIATNTIAEMLPEIIGLLETRMDNLMVSLQASQTQFVEIYNAVRALNNTATNKLSATVTTINADTKAAVANAKITVTATNINRLSSTRGYNTIQNLIEGVHELEVSHPNYKAQTIPFTVVSNETTEIIIEMVANK